MTNSVTRNCTIQIHILDVTKHVSFRGTCWFLLFYEEGTFMYLLFTFTMYVLVYEQGTADIQTSLERFYGSSVLQTFHKAAQLQLSLLWGPHDALFP